MFPPSAAVLINRVDIYRSDDATDVDGGYTPTYTIIAKGVPCSVQQDRSVEILDESSSAHIGNSTGGRITQVNEYSVMFGRNMNLKPRDKMLWRDQSGIRHTLIVTSDENCAGRGAAYVVSAVERQ